MERADDIEARPQGRPQEDGHPEQYPARRLRHVAIVGNHDHGKSLLAGALVRSSLEPAGVVGKLTRQESKFEGTRRLTLHSTVHRLKSRHQEENPARGGEREGGRASGSEGGEATSQKTSREDARDGQDDLLRINVIDTPGHGDFAAEAEAGVRIADSALVVVDCIEGVSPHTERMIRVALSDRVKPILVINKIDRALIEYQLSVESLYQRLLVIVETFSVILATYCSDWMIRFEQNVVESVVFASAIYGWGFNLRCFASMLRDVLGLVCDQPIERMLWGDNFYNPSTKNWQKTSDAGNKKLDRGFCHFILKPISRLIRCSLAGPSCRGQLNKYLGRLHVTLTEDESELKGKLLLRCIMSKFLPLSVCLVETIFKHAPSPTEAQLYRVEQLYERGLDEDSFTNALRSCDKTGPTMIYVDNIIASTDLHSKSYAVCRVFSGTVRLGDKLYPLRLQFNYAVPDRHGKLIKAMCYANGSDSEKAEAGDIVYLSAQGLVAGDTCVSSVDLRYCGRFRPVRSAHSYLTVHLGAKAPEDLPKLVEDLRWLGSGGASLGTNVGFATSGELYLSATGETLLEEAREILTKRYGLDISWSETTVSYRETVTSVSQDCVSRSPNRHTRIWMNAEPLTEGLATDIDEMRLPTLQPSLRASVLDSSYGWSFAETRRIWGWGPTESGTNVLVNRSNGVQYMEEIKDSAMTAFQYGTLEGVLCDEQLRGIRFNIVDATLANDAIHRGAGQVIPTVRRVMRAAQLSASTKIMEPVVYMEIVCEENALGGIYSVLNRRRGYIMDQQPIISTSMLRSTAMVPLEESVGFTFDVRQASGGYAYAHGTFDHWSELQGDPLDGYGLIYDKVMKVRQRKGLSLAMPSITDYTM